jgi:hypothetical protein
LPQLLVAASQAAAPTQRGTTAGGKAETHSMFVWLMAVDWWLMLICSERKVLLAGCWWLVCSERNVLLAGG